MPASSLTIVLESGDLDLNPPSTPISASPPSCGWATSKVAYTGSTPSLRADTASTCQREHGRREKRRGNEVRMQDESWG